MWGIFKCHIGILNIKKLKLFWILNEFAIKVLKEYQLHQYLNKLLRKYVYLYIFNIIWLEFVPSSQHKCQFTAHKEWGPICYYLGGILLVSNVFILKYKAMWVADQKKINTWTFPPSICDFWILQTQKISKWWDMTRLLCSCYKFKNKCKWKSRSKWKYGGINSIWNLFYL